MLTESPSAHFSSATPVVLGSQSPRRIELLRLLIDSSRIRVRPPADNREAGFDECSSLAEILQQLGAIARTKNESVRQQLSSDEATLPVLTADTVVVAAEEDGRLVALGKPDGPHWKQTVRNWFQRYYSGRSHYVVTGICLSSGDQFLCETQVQTEIRFRTVSQDELDWYLETGEPLGKAGGYGLQGAAGIFVDSISGSPSNVIGLPLSECWKALRENGLL